MDNLTFRHSVLLLEGLKVSRQSSYAVFIVILVAYVFAVVSNIGLLILISTEKNLHDPMHLLYCNLPLNDILGTTVMFPRLLNDILKETSERYITFAECVTQAYFVHIFIASSHYVLMIMAFDRYVAIFLTVRLSHCRYKIENPFCDNASLFKLSCEDVSVNNMCGIVYTLIVGFLSALYIFITYVRIATVCITRKSKALNSKAIKTCSTHLAVYIILFICGAIFIFLHRFPEYSESRKLAGIMLHIVPSGLNPFVYGLQTKEIRDKVVKFCCTCITKVTVQAVGRVMSTLVVQECHFWLCLMDMEVDKNRHLNAQISRTGFSGNVFSHPGSEEEPKAARKQPLSHCTKKKNLIHVLPVVTAITHILYKASSPLLKEFGCYDRTQKMLSSPSSIASGWVEQLGYLTMESHLPGHPSAEPAHTPAITSTLLNCPTAGTLVVPLISLAWSQVHGNSFPAHALAFPGEGRDTAGHTSQDEVGVLQPSLHSTPEKQWVETDLGFALAEPCTLQNSILDVDAEKHFSNASVPKISLQP
ncbi:uncharacterized protein [Paramisgurnus dabryanus]|uniref:uncharacterized protein n=1 Tax=Paramisgurnus dabryanus TaxID=90735 RepID=UPI0031F39D45